MRSLGKSTGNCTGRLQGPFHPETGRRRMKTIYRNLFQPLKFNGLRLKNRITMAPLYLGDALEGGTVSPFPNAMPASSWS